MITRDQLIEIGLFNKPHGVNGEVSATLDIDAAHLAGCSYLIAEIDGIFVPFFVNSFRGKGAGKVLLTIDGLDSDIEAAMLATHEAYVLKTDFERLAIDDDDDAYPLDFFIGFTVKDGDLPVGEIVDINDDTDNVLFVVQRADGSLVQLPAVDDLIHEIETENQTLIMDLPTGILDI